VWWMHYFHHSDVLNNGLGLYSIVGIPLLQHILSLVDVTMGTKACTILEAK
jgi:hypothetical protein